MSLALSLASLCQTESGQSWCSTRLSVHNLWGKLAFDMAWTSSRILRLDRRALATRAKLHTRFHLQRSLACRSSLFTRLHNSLTYSEVVTLLS